jgi:hypothetical protein
MSANLTTPANLTNLTNPANQTNPESRNQSNPESPIPNPALYAAVYRLPHADAVAVPLAAIAAEFSPRFELSRDDLVAIDISGLERLLGPARAVGEELQRTAAARGVRVHVAVAGTRGRGSRSSTRAGKRRRSRRCRSAFSKESTTTKRRVR